MDSATDLDDSGVLALLARASYAAESSSSIVSLATPPPREEPPAVVTNLAEARLAVEDTIASASRMLSIYTQDLEPAIYEQNDFLEAVKSFVLSRNFAKVRILLANPDQVADSNRFIAMGRRLPSYIDIRHVAKLIPQRSCAYIIVDDHTILYRLRADTWDGIIDRNNPVIVQQYLSEFDEVWNVSSPEYALRVSIME